jgi:deoxyribose-phosphate aldolase
MSRELTKSQMHTVENVLDSVDMDLREIIEECNEDTDIKLLIAEALSGDEESLIELMDICFEAGFGVDIESE